jgi:hypothetical protein
MAKRNYWNHIGLLGEERVKTEIAFYKSLPSLAKVEIATNIPTDTGYRMLQLVGHKGTSLYIPVPIGGAVSLPPRPPPTEEQLYAKCASGRCIEGALKSGELLFGHRNGIGASNGYPKPTEYWRNVFKTFDSNTTPEQKVEELKKIGFLNEHDTVETAAGFFPIRSFQGSPQLWKRLAGDESWRAEGEARIRALTNGWQYVPPKFKRDAMVAAGTNVALPVTSVPAQPPQPAVVNTTPTNAPPQAVEAPKPAAPQTAALPGSSTDREAWIWVGLCAFIVACAAGLWFLRR